MTKLNSKHNILKGEKPEIGNPIHIKKLRDHEAYESEFYDYGIEIGHKKTTCSGRIFLYFTCAECGNPDVCATINLSDIFEDTIDLTEEDENAKCNNCNCEYRYSNGLLKITHNPLHPEKLNKEDFA